MGQNEAFGGTISWWEPNSWDTSNFEIPDLLENFQSWDIPHRLRSTNKLWHKLRLHGQAGEDVAGIGPGP
jgi:hypothetical protein